MKTFQNCPMTTLLVSIALLASSGIATADWTVGDPAKWVQLPDLSPQGMDVNATIDRADIGVFPVVMILADDFQCTSTEPVTDIHIWGSWKNDVLPESFSPIPPVGFVQDPGLVQFRLSIHADIPANASGLGYSTPGDELWSGLFDPGDFSVRPIATDIEEGWLDPLSGNFLFPGDTMAFQYNFLIEEAAAFVQQGTPTNPVIYWLDVTAYYAYVNRIADGLGVELERL